MDIPNPGGKKLKQGKTQEYTDKKGLTLPVPVKEKGHPLFLNNMYAGMCLSANGLQTEEIRKADIQFTAIARFLYPVQKQAIFGT